MVVRAAIKLDGRGGFGSLICLGSEFESHDQIFKNIIDCKKEDPEVLPLFPMAEIIYGFVTDKGEFLNRCEAASHAFESKQLPQYQYCPIVLMSTDLWEKERSNR